MIRSRPKQCSQNRPSAPGQHTQVSQYFLAVFIQTNSRAVYRQQVVALNSLINRKLLSVDCHHQTRQVIFNDLTLELRHRLQAVQMPAGMGVLQHHDAFVVRIADRKGGGRQSVEKRFFHPDVLFAEGFVIVQVVA